MAKELVYEYVIDKYTIKELKRCGLTENGIIAFADDIMFRYFGGEYLDEQKIDELNEEE